MVEHRSGDGEPVYLTLQDVLELHGLIIGATADVAADQLRNRAGLEGAIVRPETYAHYQEADLALQAAVLAHFDGLDVGEVQEAWYWQSFGWGGWLLVEGHVDGELLEASSGDFGGHAVADGSECFCLVECNGARYVARTRGRAAG